MTCFILNTRNFKAGILEWVLEIILKFYAKFCVYVYFGGERFYNFHQIVKSTCKPPSLDLQKGKKYCRAHYLGSLSPSLGKAWKLGIELKSSLAFFLNFLHMCGLMCLRRVLQQVNNSVLSLLLHLSYIDLWEIIILSKSNASHCQFGSWCLVKVFEVTILENIRGGILLEVLC